jgi:UDPglucose--hexose-1-phosphate uridylyltransferase
MSELRWDPTLREWVATATHRMDRPQMPKDWCPFCPGSGRVPENYDVHLYANDFPTYQDPPPEPDFDGDDFYRVRPAYGYCDVVLYHPDHNTSLAQLHLDHIEKLIRLWIKRFKELKAKQDLKYVLVFENNGEVIGVTMPHPHGQIYSFPFVPPRIERQVLSAGDYFKSSGKCLFCAILEREEHDAKRIVFKHEHYTAFVPFYAHWPYEVHIYPRRHFAYIDELGPEEITGLGAAIRTILRKYNNLYGFAFPYMMMLYQAPVDGGEYPGFHFHIEFYPPYRSRDKLKYLAGVETGGGTFINDSAAEEKAAQLRRSKS